MATGSIKIELDEESMQLVEERIDKLKISLVEVQELLMSIQPTVKTEVSECDHFWMKARLPHESEWTHMVCDSCHEEIHPS